MSKIELSEYKSAEFIKEKSSSDGINVVNFSGDWCGPCVAMRPDIRELDTDDVGFDVFMIDVKANPDEAARLGVRGVPAFFVYENGELKGSFTGRTTGEMFARRVHATVAGEPDPAR